MADDLNDEARRATEMLAGKRVRRIWRHRPYEAVIEFTDGTRLFVDGRDVSLELSVTDGPNGDG